MERTDSNNIVTGKLILDDAVIRILMLAYDHAKRDGDLSRENVLRLARDYGRDVGITEPICKRALNMTLSEILGI